MLLPGFGVGVGMLDFPGGSAVKNPLAKGGDGGSILGWGRAPGEEREMATHSSILPWEIPQTALVGYSLWGVTEAMTTPPTKVRD